MATDTNKNEDMRQILQDFYDFTQTYLEIIEKDWVLDDF